MAGHFVRLVHEVTPVGQVHVVPVEMLQWNGTGSLPVRVFVTLVGCVPPHANVVRSTVSYFVDGAPAAGLISDTQ